MWPLVSEKCCDKIVSAENLFEIIRQKRTPGNVV